MSIRDPYANMPQVRTWERAEEVFTKLGGDKYVRTVSLHRLRNKDYQLRWDTETNTFSLLRNGRAVITYHKPALLGGRVVHIVNPNFKNMNGFFRHHGWQSWVPRLLTTRGDYVTAPLVPHKPTILTFDADNNLMVDASSHGEVYTMYASDEAKEKIVELHERIEPLVNLCLIRVDEFLHHADVIYRYANRTFVGIDTSMWVGNYGRAEDIIRDFCYAQQPNLNDAVIQAFFAVTEEIVKFKLSKRWAKTQTFIGGANRFDRAKAGVLPEDIRDSLQYVATKLVGLDKPNAKRQLPSFPSKLPRRVFL